MKKILLIEDNKDIRENLAEILELSNYEVFVAENGKTGIEKAINHLPDLIICDIMMPELDGYGVLHAVHRNKDLRKVPFIFLTAKTDRNDFRKGMEMGADDYITKPFSGTEILNAIDSRLKKIELLKTELLPGVEGVQHFMESHLDKESLDMLAEEGKMNKFKKKEIIFSEGNWPHFLYLIRSGKVKVYKTNDNGKELITGLYGPGDFLGYVPMLEETTYQDSASAMEDSEVVTIPGDIFSKLIFNNRDIAQKFIQLLARDVSEKENQLMNLTYNSLRRKVANALVLLEKKYIQNEEKAKAISISRGSLATIVGAAKESLIRTLGDFRSEGLIDIEEDGGILILKKGKLESMRD
ncbi:MAG: response regulator [Chitinophagaceae bacterium]|nr:response regulator [Chitinophagaceae bacterium]